MTTQGEWVVTGEPLLEPRRADIEVHVPRIVRGIDIGEM
jgi:hypothetical protein